MKKIEKGREITLQNAGMGDICNIYEGLEELLAKKERELHSVCGRTEEDEEVILKIISIKETLNALSGYTFKRYDIEGDLDRLRVCETILERQIYWSKK